MVLACVSATAFGRIYRWVDSDGSVHYSDKIPPDKVDRGRTTITDTGIAIEAVPPAKTPEERRREQELERLRIQQQELIARQTAADNRLLRTYRSVDDVLMARDGKLAGIDALVGVARGHIRRQQEWLVDLYREAANLELGGEPVPSHLRDSILKSESSIRDSYAKIVEEEQQKQQIRESFARDLKRYRQLVGLPEGQAYAGAAGSSEPSPLDDLPNLVTCASEAQCDALWRRAVDYVRQRSSTPVQRESENLIVTAAPRKAEEIGLILSRIQNRDGEQTILFLDAQCQARRRDSQECLAPGAAALLEGFREALSQPYPGFSDPSSPGLAPADQGANSFVGKEIQQ